MRKMIIALFASILFFASSCAAEGLNTLIELGKSQAEIQKEYAAETKAFENVKTAIESGAIRKGDTKKSILDRYGESVIVVKDRDGAREDWIYKPSESSFFEGVRAILIFTEDGLLDEFRLDER